MTLTVNSLGDNPQQPGIAAEAYIPDQLVAGNLKLVTDNGTVSQGASVLQRGTVMGQQTIGSASAAAKTGGNTGNGTLVMDATTPVLANAQVGVYTVTCTVAGANAATFRVVDPKGDALGDVSFSGAGASATFADQIKFAVTDGATDFIVGDEFNITVAAGTGNWIESVKTATDGSQNPAAILADYVDPTAGAVLAPLYVMGEFNQNALTMDASWTAATLKPILRPLGIYLKSSVSAADPA